MRRFFIEPDLVDDDTVCLAENESKHIVKVLRLKVGDEIELLDGRGLVYLARIEQTGRSVKARIVERLQVETANRVRLVVGQGQLKGKKMDMVLQKCTELGVDCFQPVWSVRCQGKLSEHQGVKKLERGKRIIEAACKQSYRSSLMELDETIGFDDVLDLFPTSEGRLKLLFWEEEQEVSLHDLNIDDGIREVVLLLGPEGGLTREEADSARRQGWCTVSLGKRILRAETATFTAVSIVQYLCRNI